MQCLPIRYLHLLEHREWNRFCTYLGCQFLGSVYQPSHIWSSPCLPAWDLHEFWHMLALPSWVLLSFHAGVHF